MSLEQAVGQLADQLKKSDSPNGKQHQDIVKALNTGFDKVAKEIREAGVRVEKAIRDKK